jgi:hypothetical protein
VAQQHPPQTAPLLLLLLIRLIPRVQATHPLLQVPTGLLLLLVLQQLLPYS